MPYTPRTIRNIRKSWPFGPSNFSAPQVAQRGPTLPPATRADARAGLHFQDHLVDTLRAAYSGTQWAVCPDWWLEYTLDGKRHFAGPDILLINPIQGKIVIIECKLTCTDAYKQLFLYMGLLRKLMPYPAWTISGFLAYKKSSQQAPLFGGPVMHLMDPSIDLTPFEWDGFSIPTIGVFSTAFVPIPAFG